MASTAAWRPSYDALSNWRRVCDALPERLRIPEPWPVREDWLTVGHFNVHLDRWSAEAPSATVIIVHGVGGNGRMLGLYGHMCRSLGYDAVAPDLPGYGLTGVPSKLALTYEDWRTVLAAVIEAEAARRLPVIVFGLSMGGMLGYDATARTRLPKGLFVTCLTGLRNPAVRRGVARWPWLGTVIEPLLTTVPALTDPLPVFMKVAGNMSAVANDRAVVRAIMADPRAGGNWMPARFLRTLLMAEPELAPEAFDVCPVTLAHPADDRWTNVSISRILFDRLGHVPTELVMLENGGHFPVEYPAHEQLTTAFRRFAESAIASTQQAVR
jgi:alpha-beta hydrolase superfamily lysophospholipase